MLSHLRFLNPFLQETNAQIYGSTSRSWHAEILGSCHQHWGACDYSMQFQSEFVTLLSRTCGTQRVKANNIYQDYIQGKNHLYVNATRWDTLAGFISYLAQAGIVRVEDTEEETFISWIDDSSKALAKAVSHVHPFPLTPDDSQEATMKTERLNKSDEQREHQVISVQIEHTAAIEQQARGGQDKAGSSGSNFESPSDLSAGLPKPSWTICLEAATHRSRTLLLKPSSEWPLFKCQKQLRIDYHPQATLSLCPHNRPPDAPRNIGLQGEELVQEVTIGRLERCYANQPKYAAGSVPTLTIVLEEELAGGIRESPAQTWTARDAGHERVVAKIFDPLYFQDESSTLDAFRIVNYSVAMECESYKRLASLQGSQIPKFLGLYLASFAIPDYPTRFTPPPPSRNVYVLLMEYVAGTALDKIIVKELDPPKRAKIVDDAFELMSHALALGVCHADFFPRNLILRPGQGGAKDTVVMFDFEQVSSMEMDGEWDSSEASRSRRITEIRANPSLHSWIGAGWFTTK